MKKIGALWPKAWVNPFENAILGTFKNLGFHSQKKFLFYLEHYYTLFLALF